MKSRNLWPQKVLKHWPQVAATEKAGEVRTRGNCGILRFIYRHRVYLRNGATIFSITALCIKALIIMGFFFGGGGELAPTTTERVEPLERLLRLPDC